MELIGHSAPSNERPGVKETGHKSGIFSILSSRRYCSFDETRHYLDLACFSKVPLGFDGC
jgi:hypothetical protein